MALGHKTGGRKAGTPNRKTQEIGELLESLGHNPIEAMVQIATGPNASLELRGRMNAELAHYVYPKRKAVEVKGDQANPQMPNKIRNVIVDPRTGNEKDIGSAGPSTLPTPGDNDPMSESDPMS
jgi:hypothetical protein